MAPRPFPHLAAVHPQAAGARKLARQRTGTDPTRPSGFTLVELMVAVAIIGILAAVALPAYQDYAKRSRVTEGLSLASGAKTAVTEFYVNNGKFPTTNDAAGLPPKISGRSVSDVQVGTDGAITVTFNEKVETGTQLTLTPKDGEGSINWACAAASTKGVKAAYLPSECKPDATV